MNRKRQFSLGSLLACMSWVFVALWFSHGLTAGAPLLGFGMAIGASIGNLAGRPWRYAMMGFLVGLGLALILAELEWDRYTR
jgi:hypothetical protein